MLFHMLPLNMRPFRPRGIKIHLYPSGGMAVHVYSMAAYERVLKSLKPDDGQVCQSLWFMLNSS